jgi:hypothetical protein
MFPRLPQLPGRIALKDPEHIRNRHAIGSGFGEAQGIGERKNGNE